MSTAQQGDGIAGRSRQRFVWIASGPRRWLASLLERHRRTPIADPEDRGMGHSVSGLLGIDDAWEAFDQCLAEADRAFFTAVAPDLVRGRVVARRGQLLAHVPVYGAAFLGLDGYWRLEAFADRIASGQTVLCRHLFWGRLTTTLWQERLNPQLPWARALAMHFANRQLAMRAEAEAAFLQSAAAKGWEREDAIPLDHAGLETIIEAFIEDGNLAAALDLARAMADARAWSWDWPCVLRELERLPPGASMSGRVARRDAERS